MTNFDPSAVLDLTVLDELRSLGGDDDSELVAEVVNTFLEDAPERLQMMQAAVSSRDLDALSQAAHAMKSSSAYLGATMLSAIFQEIEMIARGRSKGDVRTHVDRCLAEFERVKAALKAITS
jgi:HPt (histidine-containing phosphotransfer) domain-containing protein